MEDFSTSRRSFIKRGAAIFVGASVGTAKVFPVSAAASSNRAIQAVTPGRVVEQVGRRVIAQSVLSGLDIDAAIQDFPADWHLNNGDMVALFREPNGLFSARPFVEAVEGSAEEFHEQNGRYALGESVASVTHPKVRSEVDVVLGLVERGAQATIAGAIIPSNGAAGPIWFGIRSSVAAGIAELPS